jgi:hypothetical protein
VFDSEPILHFPSVCDPPYLRIDRPENSESLIEKSGQQIIEKQSSPEPRKKKAPVTDPGRSNSLPDAISGTILVSVRRENTHAETEIRSATKGRQTDAKPI